MVAERAVFLFEELRLEAAAGEELRTATVHVKAV